MQKPWAVNDFIIDDRSGFTGTARVNSTIKSILEGGIGLPGAGAQLAQRYGRWPLVSGLQRPGLRLNLTTYFLTCTAALRYAQRNSLLAELNPELEIMARLYAADYLAPEGLIGAFGPWDVYPDSDAAWHCRSLLWERGGDGELAARLEGDLTGAINFRDGPNSRQRAIVIEAAATNLLGNPSGETNTTGWSKPWGDTLTIVNDEVTPPFGDYCFKLVEAGAAGFGAYYTDIAGLTPGNVVTVTGYVYVPGTNTTTTTMNLVVWDGGGFVNAVTDASTVNDEWQRLEVQKTVPAGGSIRVGFYRSVTAAGEFVYFDAVQVENSDYATTYVDGSLGPGYTWSGTAHGSTSTRAVSYFSLDDEVDLINGKGALTFRCLARAPYDADGDWYDTFNNYLFQATDGASVRIGLFFSETDDRFRLNINGTNVATSAVQTFSAGDWLDMVAVADFDNSAFKIYINGVLDGSGSLAAASPLLTLWKLGSNAAGSGFQGNFWFAEYDIYDRALNAAEIVALYTNGAAHLRARYLNVLCEASQPLVIDGVPTSRGNVSTLAVDDDVRWRSRDGDVHFWSVYNDTWGQKITVDSNDDVRPVIRITPDAAKDAGTGFLYKRPVLIEWKAPSSAENYPVTFSLDTSTLSGAGKVQADLDDLRVYVGGLEVDRWLDSTTPAAGTKIWINLDFSAHLEYDLKTAIAGAGAITEIEIDEDEDISTLPASGLVLIDSEVFVYTGKNNADRTLTGVVRAMRGTSAAAHTVGDIVKWIQHDVLIVYGDSSLSAPVTNDDFKPILNLSTSTNDSWVYANFGEDNKPRAAGWHSEVVQDPLPFDDSYSDFEILTGGASPWTDIEIDNLLYLGDAPGGTSGPAATGKVGEARWKVNNVCGITNAVFSNITGPGANYVPRVDTAMQSSEDGSTWVREASVSAALDPVNQALNASGLDKWVALYSFNTVSYGDNSSLGNSADIKVSDVTLTLYTTLTPDTTVQAEETAYQISAILTNDTTGQALKIDFISDLDETLEIDTDADTVTYLMDGTSQQQAIQQVGGAEREQFRLAPGVNELAWSDTGTNDLDMQFFWDRRDWE